MHPIRHFLYAYKRKEIRFYRSERAAVAEDTALISPLLLRLSFLTVGLFVELLIESAHTLDILSLFCHGFSY
jgi:hypothetical protein